MDIASEVQEMAAALNPAVLHNVVHHPAAHALVQNLAALNPAALNLVAHKVTWDAYG